METIGTNVRGERREREIIIIIILKKCSFATVATGKC